MDNVICAYTVNMYSALASSLSLVGWEGVAVLQRAKGSSEPSKKVRMRFYLRLSLGYDLIMIRVESVCLSACLPV